jgi:hypothetical protein
MNKSQFTSFMKSPSVLPPESIQLLGDVLQEFPYCQTAQLLYVKSLHLQNSIHYNKQLKIAAAYATDRSLLYHLIMHPVTGQTEDKTITLKAVSRNDEQIVTELKQGAPPTNPEHLTLVRTPMQIIEARLLELDELKKKTESELLEGSSTDAALSSPALPVETETKKPGSTEVSIPNNAGLPVRKPATVPEPENITEPIHTGDTLRTVEDLETLSGSYISTAIDASIQIEIEEKSSAQNETSADEETDQPEAAEENFNRSKGETSEFSFSDWLKKSGKPEIPKPDPVLEKQNEEKRHKETELIEKFIKEEPRISKPKKEFYSPISMARQSVVEDLDFVTETLAGIYAKQGNTSKAIRAYQTLSLRYPEKKLYFASLIEKLENGE